MCVSLHPTESGLVFSSLRRYIEELVQGQVAQGIPSHRIVVGGFSQGGAIALLMLRSKLKLGAVIGGCVQGSHWGLQAWLAGMLTSKLQTQERQG